MMGEPDPTAPCTCDLANREQPARHWVTCAVWDRHCEERGITLDYRRQVDELAVRLEELPADWRGSLHIVMPEPGRPMTWIELPESGSDE
jgi:hypothetical protein